MAKMNIFLAVLFVGTATIYSKSLQDDLESTNEPIDDTIENKRGLSEFDEELDDFEGEEEAAFSDLEVERGLDDMEMEEETIEKRGRKKKKKLCPDGFKRFDINAKNSKKFNLQIIPNHNKQRPEWGLAGAEDMDNFKESHLRMRDNDYYTVEPKKSIRPCLCGRICFETFVVDWVYILVYRGRRMIGNYTYEPQRTTTWFRPVCTPNMGFKEITQIKFLYKHQPPNFNMKSLNVTACIEKKR